MTPLAAVFWVIWIVWVILGAWVDVHGALAVTIPQGNPQNYPVNVVEGQPFPGSQPRVTVKIPEPHRWIHRFIHILLAILILILGLRVFA